MRQFKILITLLTIMLLTTSVSADAENDNFMKKQCQYLVYGNGSSDSFMYGTMVGILEGITFTIKLDERTDFVKDAAAATIILKACQNTFNNITEDGFFTDFKTQVVELSNKKYN